MQSISRNGLLSIFFKEPVSKSRELKDDFLTVDNPSTSIQNQDTQPVASNEEVAQFHNEPVIQQARKANTISPSKNDQYTVRNRLSEVLYASVKFVAEGRQASSLSNNIKPEEKKSLQAKIDAHYRELESEVIRICGPLRVQLTGKLDGNSQGVFGVFKQPSEQRCANDVKTIKQPSACWFQFGLCNELSRGLTETGNCEAKQIIIRTLSNMQQRLEAQEKSFIDSLESEALKQYYQQHHYRVVSDWIGAIIAVRDRLYERFNFQS